VQAGLQIIHRGLPNNNVTLKLNWNQFKCLSNAQANCYCKRQDTVHETRVYAMATVSEWTELATLGMFVLRGVWVAPNKR